MLTCYFQDGRRVGHETRFPGKRRTDNLSNRSFRETSGNIHIIIVIFLEKEVKGDKEMRIGKNGHRSVHTKSLELER